MRLPRHIVTLGCLLLCVSAFGQVSPRMSPDMRAILSRFQAMSHGYHAEAEWEGLFQELDEIATRAENEGRVEEVIEAGLLKAMVYSDMRRDYLQALSTLNGIKEKYGHMHIPAIRRVYVRQAEVYADLGDEDAIRDLIRDFKSSPHHDAQPATYSGGQGRDVPLAVTRPWGKGSDSLTITAMERYRLAARLAPGRMCPAFETVDTRGVSLRLSDYQGQVVLLDFWMSRWEPWKRELPRLVQAYRTYHPYGFEIIGISLDAEPGAGRQVLMRYGATWRQVAGDRRLPSQFQVFGEATNFLIDKDGSIIGRDLEGSELVREIKNALEMP